MGNNPDTTKSHPSSRRSPDIFRDALKLAVKSATRVSASTILQDGQGAARWAGEAYPVTANAKAQHPETADDPWQRDRPSAYCPICGCTAGPGAVTPSGCPVCVDRRLPWHTVTRLSAYTEPVNRWVLQMKYHRQWHWTYWFADQLAEAIKPATRESIDVICHVPMHWSRRWRRGYDQAELLARRLADKIDRPFEPLLRRPRRTPKQTMIPRAERLANVRHALAAESVDLSRQTVLLVDDVKTSGATLRACSRLLKQAGAQRVEVAVVAVAKE